MQVVVAVVALSCGDNGDGNADGTGTETEADSGGSSGDDDPSATEPTSSVDDTVGNPCGNGVIDEGEECDDGEANSNDTPNACREFCALPTCGDFIVDDGEECDDGEMNSDEEPNACRTTCVSPICGDAVQDAGEACDDGNEEWGDQCFECTRLYYYILNAPAGGDDWIIRSNRDGDTTVLVEPDPDFDGMLQLAIDPDGAVLYALQSVGTLNRVVWFDANTGEFVDSASLDDLGYTATPHAMALFDDGILYVALDGEDTTRIVSVAPATATAMEVADLGELVPVADMTFVPSDGLYMTTGAAGTIVRVEVPGYAMSTIASDIPEPIGIAYDDQMELLWFAAHSPGSPATAASSTLDGTVEPFNPLTGYNDPAIRGVAVDIGNVLLFAVSTANVVATVEALGGVSEFFTEMLDTPMDIEILDLGR
jgi:hypothetical protein